MSSNTLICNFHHLLTLLQCFLFMIILLEDKLLITFKVTFCLSGLWFWFQAALSGCTVRAGSVGCPVWSRTWTSAPSTWTALRPDWSETLWSWWNPVWTSWMVKWVSDSSSVLLWCLKNFIYHQSRNVSFWFQTCRCFTPSCWPDSGPWPRPSPPWLVGCVANARSGYWCVRSRSSFLSAASCSSQEGRCSAHWPDWREVRKDLFYFKSNCQKV